MLEPFVEIAPYLLFLMFVFAVYRVFNSKRRKTYYGQTMDAPAPPSPPPSDDSTKTDQEPMSPGKRFAAVCFLGVWLTFWTFGCYMAIGAARDLSHGEEGFIFMRIWLAFAIPAWFFVAWTLFRLLRGDNVDIQFDGDGDGGD